MSQFRELEVWSEREAGDWEACVATAYGTALLYGGVTMAAPYTQTERERLEVRADEPQDLGATDTKSRLLYGVALRGPTVTTSKAAFLARPGVGFCLTGVGSPVGAQVGTFTHEVFGYARSTTIVRVYDPLRAPGSQPTDMTVTALAAWMNGIAAHQVREVRRDEFVANIVVKKTLFLGADGKPAQRSISFAANQTYTGWALDGTTRVFKTGVSASSAPSDGRCEIVRDDGKAPKGSGFIYITAGVFAAHPYLAEAQAGISVPPDPTAPPPTPTDCTAAVKAATDPLNAEIANLKGIISTHNKVEADMKGIT